MLELAELVADVAASTGGARPEVHAPPHEGPLPPRVDVDVARLALHVPVPAVPLAQSVQELIELCRAARGAGGAVVDG